MSEQEFNVYNNKFNIDADSKHIIFTVSPEAEQIALNELRAVNSAIKLIKWIDHGIGMVFWEEGFNSLAEIFREKPPVFIRHICPVHTELKLELDSSYMDMIVEAAMALFPLLDENKTFSVQTRMFGKGERPYERFDVNGRIAEKIEARGLALNVRKPDNVISVICTADIVYIGVSLAADNLSDWGGGAHRFVFEDEQICRAEFKLLEAIDVFKLALPAGGNALDLGAAPGGWTRVLRNHNLRVAAVDPAELHPSIASDTGVVHHRQTAQIYFQSKEKFDIIVNDMRMDVRESAQIMGMAAECLKPDGLAVMTLKLPAKGMQKLTNQALEMLKKWYKVVGARQLFHNRNEVTVVLKHKDVN